MKVFLMWFTRKAPPEKILYFKDAESAFEISCSQMVCDIEEGATLPAIVLAANDVQDMQAILLKVAGLPAGIEVPTFTTGRFSKNLKVGDFVTFRIHKINNSGGIKIIGFVESRLKPEYNLQKGWVKDG